MLGSNKGSMYLNMKPSFESEKYLTILPANLRITYCKFRTGNHNLPVEAGRWEKPKIDHKKRLCDSCHKYIGDEYHFLLVCPLLKAIRDKHLPEYFTKFPNSHKFRLLLNKSNDELILKIVKCILESSKFRKKLINPTVNC